MFQTLSFIEEVSVSDWVFEVFAFCGQKGTKLGDV